MREKDTTGDDEVDENENAGGDVEPEAANDGGESEISIDTPIKVSNPLKRIRRHDDDPTSPPPAVKRPKVKRRPTTSNVRPIKAKTRSKRTSKGKPLSSADVDEDDVNMDSEEIIFLGHSNPKSVFADYYVSNGMITLHSIF
jgi:hypothetical protein